MTNQESFCCARDKRRYLREVFRSARAGRRLVVHRLQRAERALSRAESAELRKVLRGFHIASLAPWRRWSRT